MALKYNVFQELELYVTVHTGPLFQILSITPFPSLMIYWYSQEATVTINSNWFAGMDDVLLLSY